MITSKMGAKRLSHVPLSMILKSITCLMLSTIRGATSSSMGKAQSVIY
jgi:hypothetical protein